MKSKKRWKLILTLEISKKTERPYLTLTLSSKCNLAPIQEPLTLQDQVKIASTENVSD